MTELLGLDGLDIPLWFGAILAVAFAIPFFLAVRVFLDVQPGVRRWFKRLFGE